MYYFHFILLVSKLKPREKPVNFLHPIYLWMASDRAKFLGLFLDKQLTGVKLWK
jgi:hypothetical protein